MEKARHYYYEVDQENQDYDNVDALMDVLECAFSTRPIIFCNSIKTIDYLYEEIKNFHSCSPWVRMYGGMSENEIAHAINLNQNYSSSVIASNIMAKNCDCCDLIRSPLVINFDIPTHKDIYKHRASRTCDYYNRNGNVKSGVVITFYDEDLDDDLEELELKLNVEFISNLSLNNIKTMF